MKKFLLFAAALAVAGSASAATDFVYNGISYTVLDDGSGVKTSPDGANASASGDVVIPKVVQNGSIAYKVLEEGTQSFMGANNMTSLKLPDSVTKIGASAFGSTANCKKFDLGQGLEVIEELAFGGYLCGLEELAELPETLYKIDGNPFITCYNLTNIPVSPDSPYFKTVDGVLYTKSGKTLQAYPFGKGVAEVVIPEGVDSIAPNMFNSLYKSNKYYDDINGVEQTVVRPALGKVTFPSTLKFIGRNAFFWCRTATNTNPIPDGVEEIGTICFKQCRAMTLNVPKSLTRINNESFADTYIPEIVIPAGVTQIGMTAFNLVKNCKSITFEEGSKLELIDFNAFAGMTNCTATELILPEGLKTIGNSAFSGLSAVSTLKLPSTIESIGASAFSGMSSLPSFVWPENITTIGTGTFNGCSKIEEFVVPATVTSVGDNAFSNMTALKSIDFGSNVEKIGNAALNNCKNLEKIICRATVPPVYGTYYASLSKVNFTAAVFETAELYVPDASIDDYKATPELVTTTLNNVETQIYTNPFWGQFVNVKPLSTNGVIEDVIAETATEEVVSVSYYDITGRKVEAPANGKFYIRVEQMKDGATKTTKVVNF